MKFCTDCGTQMEVHLTTCPSCGNAPISDKSPSTTSDAEANKTMAILAYILFFVPLLTGAHKSSEFVKFHTNQGIVIALGSIAYGIVSSILLTMLSGMFLFAGGWGIYGLFSSLIGLLWLAPTVFAVMGIVSAVQGKTQPLPIIGNIKLLK